MSRLNLLLFAILLLCALSVVNATNQQRRIFIELGRAQAEERALQQDWSQLQYQQGALSKASRIESVATAQLKMQSVTPERTQYITVAPASASSPAPASAAAAVGGAS